ncbi:MAG: GNAT family N-acetyltransferase [Beijerinckiaceae bacterium]|nr:GNAT family N-acetyltransferase [Beijerinckiaceae bacterium]
MTPKPPRLTIEVLTSLSELPAIEWDRLALGPRDAENTRHHNALALAAESPHEAAAESECQLGESASQASDSSQEDAEPLPELPESASEADPHNPFISHAFLNALEESGSVGGRTGWTPLHLLVRDEANRPVGAMPLYAKAHSRGEYVFDHAFAEAYHRAGGRYYPKLQISVPFTPATARKMLIAPDAPEEAVTAALLGGLETLLGRIEGSSIHATFLTPADRARFEAGGYMLRSDQQFHFFNAGYAGFDDFLADLASRKRKVLKRERREALAQGITVEWLTGAALTEAHWDAFFAFYMDTGSRKWGTPYLTRAFFSRIHETMADRILLVMAKRAGRYIAGALNFIGGNTLYGRNWGAIEHHPFLHFELCYYQAIDFALAHGLRRVEAGAQGEHKLARGYRPVKTWSAHRFADPGLARAVADYLRRERHHVDQAQEELEAFTPFRRGAGPA